MFFCLKIHQFLLHSSQVILDTWKPLPMEIFFVLSFWYGALKKFPCHLPRFNSQLFWFFSFQQLFSFLWIFALSSFKKLSTTSLTVVAVSKHTKITTTRWHFSLTFWTRSYVFYDSTFPRKSQRLTFSPWLSNELLHKTDMSANLVCLISQCSTGPIYKRTVGVISYYCIQNPQPL